MNTVYKILKRHKFRVFKFTRVQYLHMGDPQRRTEFCHYLMNNYTLNGNFLNQILWTDESNFSNNGLFNIKNTHYWSQTNRHYTRDRNFQRRISINVWCGIIGTHILGPYFYEGTLTTQRYLNFLEHEFQDYLDDLPLALRARMIFQHDGAPPHNSMVVTNYLNTTFGQNWIGNRGPTAWPARSPDLSILDSFLFGKIKDVVYSSPTNNLEELKRKIRQAIQIITREELINAQRNTIRRVRLCLREGGNNFEQFL